MKVLVLGAGFVGTLVAERLRDAGHDLCVTTTTPAKADDLAARFGRAAVLRGSDREAVAREMSGVDAVVVTAGPSAAQAMTPEDRTATYEEILVETARSVVAAGGDAHLVALSALSVYGDAADGEAWVTEDSPVTSSPDASPRCFLEMERTYLGAQRRACVFRCGDVFGPGDPPIGDKVAMAHQYLGGSVPFSADALFYRLHVEDAADAVVHALGHRLTGLHNLTHPEVPPTNAALFDALSVERGLPPLVYRDEIAAPAAPISVARLAGSGFTAARSFDPAYAHLG